MNRRELLKAMMAGGVVVAGELWVPGSKLISIPSGKVFGGHDLTLNSGICTIQVCETMPGDRVRVVAYYEDGPDPVEYIVKNVMSKEISIEVPTHRNGHPNDHVEIIHGRVGDVFSRFVSPGSHLEDSGLIQQAVNVQQDYPRAEYVFEDLM